MQLATVTYEKHEQCGHVQLNRPGVLNAYNIQMRDDLYQILTAVRDDPDIRVMIISGAGRAFCAGADLTEFGTAPTPVIAREVRRNRDVWGLLKDLNVVSIAAMHGYAFGSGLELALLCDFRLAAEGTRMGLPETALGFIPAAGATQSLQRLVRPGAALRMLLTCERIDAHEAHRIGLIHRVVTGDRLPTEAVALAGRIISSAPLAAILAKQAINHGLDVSLAEGLAIESRLNDLAFTAADAWERLRSHAKQSAELKHA